MALLRQLALRGRLSDRFVRKAVRRRLLARPDRVEFRPPAESGTGEESARLWRPAELPPLIPDGNPGRRLLGDRGLAACAHWPIWAKTLTAAENEMLGLIAERAAIGAGQRVLVVARSSDALAPYLIESHGLEPTVWAPSAGRAESLRAQTSRRDLSSVEVHEGKPIQAFGQASFDRVLVLESLAPGLETLAASSLLLRPGGRLFLQLACHRHHSYRLSKKEAGWLGFDRGTAVPSTALPPRVVPELELTRHWELSGEHYERTLRAWRQRLDERRAEFLERLTPSLGREAADRGLAGWRLALLAREAMFGARGGQEWWVSQYAFTRPRR